jgi:hypothetical protein
MEAKPRVVVRERAGNCCEYCRLPQDPLPLVSFHVEHIIPRKHGGSNDLDNLALACHYCNAHKGPNLTGIDQISNEVVSLFHPRRDNWQEHFTDYGAIVAGLSPVGRATTQVLAMNSTSRLELRSELRKMGYWPPPFQRQ